MFNYAGKYSKECKLCDPNQLCPYICDFGMATLMRFDSTNKMMYHSPRLWGKDAYKCDSIFDFHDPFKNDVWNIGMCIANFLTNQKLYGIKKFKAPDGKLYNIHDSYKFIMDHGFENFFRKKRKANPNIFDLSPPLLDLLDCMLKKDTDFDLNCCLAHPFMQQQLGNKIKQVERFYKYHMMMRIYDICVNISKNPRRNLNPASALHSSYKQKNLYQMILNYFQSIKSSKEDKENSIRTMVSRCRRTLPGFKVEALY